MFNKTPASIQEQIYKLESRGCIIEDKKFAITVLKHINYFRLHHYFEPFLINKRQYKKGTSFNGIVYIYDFDRKLRSLIFTMLEIIEISFRALISNFHGMKYGALGYLNSDTFNKRHQHEYFLSKIRRMIENNGDREFIKHYQRKHKGNFPLWVVMELFSFGNLVYFFSDMKTADKKEVCKDFPDINPSYIENWLFCMNILRNHCAHYNRLFSNNFSESPKEHNKIEIPTGDTLLHYLVVAKALFPIEKQWESDFLIPLAALIDEYHNIDISKIGFPKNWVDILSYK